MLRRLFVLLSVPCLFLVLLGVTNSSPVQSASSTLPSVPAPLQQTGTATATATTAATATVTAICNQLSNYEISQSNNSVVGGINLVPGSACDDCVVSVTLPFSFRLYDLAFTSAIVGSNGVLGFVSEGNDTAHFCLPATGYPYQIFPYWHDLDMSPGTCSNCGVYTLTTGTAPNRIFHIEWRACDYLYGCSRRYDFEVRLYESGEGFDLAYFLASQLGQDATIGVQRGSSAGELYTQFSCNTQSLQEGLSLQFRQPGCALPITPIASFTPAFTPTSNPTSTATQVPINCPGARFADVCPGSYFYAAVNDLANRQVVSGYNTSPPCDSSQDVPCFLPYGSLSRGQAAKIVALASGASGPVSGQRYQDVLPGSPFYGYIMQLSANGVMGGYACGQLAGEPCVAPEDRPYFRPGSVISRGQMSKIISNAAGYSEPHEEQSFNDVQPPSSLVPSPFYIWIERLASRNIVGGYACGGPGEPCDVSNLPYFRPGTNITRGQSAKIIELVWPQSQSKK